MAVESDVGSTAPLGLATGVVGGGGSGGRGAGWSLCCRQVLFSSHWISLISSASRTSAGRKLQALRSPLQASLRLLVAFLCKRTMKNVPWNVTVIHPALVAKPVQSSLCEDGEHAQRDVPAVVT